MTRSLLKCIAPIAFALLLGGCATSSGVVVPIDTAQIAPPAAGGSAAVQVQVTDIRKEANLERTTIGGVSMGTITLQPPAPEIVKALVEAKAAQVVVARGVQTPQTVQCGIRSFEVTTPATALYWDVNAKVELVLRVHGQERTVSGAATERTYVWPSEAMIQRVTTEALRKVGDETGRALEALFAAQR